MLGRMMYLIDTNVISEVRKKRNADKGVKQFFKTVRDPVYLSVVTIGELRRGVEIIRYRGDKRQANLLEKWLDGVIENYGNNILEFALDEAIVWGRLRVPHHEHSLDKQIAATALTHGFTVVTRNDRDFVATGVNVLNPFSH